MPALAASLDDDAAVRLPAGAVHIWTISLDQPPPAVRGFEAILSSDELHRADRFAFEHLRRRFVVCRGALRQILGAYVATSPHGIRFDYGGRGKPALGATGSCRLEFNVSHAEDRAAIALCADQPIGVDIEWLERTVSFEQLATRFFSTAEAADLLSLAPGDRRAGFFNCWTRKEAYIKAIGDGLACPLHSFAVTLRPGEPAAMRWIERDDASRWTVEAFCPAPGYAGALAVRFRPSRVSVRAWTELATGVDIGSGLER